MPTAGEPVTRIARSGSGARNGTPLLIHRPFGTGTYQGSVVVEGEYDPGDAWARGRSADVSRRFYPTQHHLGVVTGPRPPRISFRVHDQDSVTRRVRHRIPNQVGPGPAAFPWRHLRHVGKTQITKERHHEIDLALVLFGALALLIAKEEWELADEVLAYIDTVDERFDRLTIDDRMPAAAEYRAAIAAAATTKDPTEPPPPAALLSEVTSALEKLAAQAIPVV